MVGVCRPGSGEAVREECGVHDPVRRGDVLSPTTAAMSNLATVPGESSESSVPSGVSIQRTYTLSSGRVAGEASWPWKPVWASWL